jgi:photosystem II stability/assembly factor-like uncharacterized protein
MILRVLASCLLFANLAMAQQTGLINLFSNGSRIDDFHLKPDGTGFLAANGRRVVLRTFDAGLTYDTVLNLRDTTQAYLRSIRILGDSLVFLGTLNANATLFRSKNGGQSWENLSARLPASVTAICGMSVVGNSHLYLTGRYFGDAYFLSSTDSGESWQFTDMRAHASNLIDVHFFDTQRGYLIGRAPHADSGAIILETLDGGSSWQNVWQSNVPGDRGWKFFMRDNQHFYVSIENAQQVPNRYAYSNNNGLSWRTDTITGFSLPMLQSVSFINADTGFAGGHFSGHLFTYNGGATWQFSPLYNGFNRAQMMGDRLFLAGSQFLFFGPLNSVSVHESAILERKHRFSKVFPNPVTQGQITARFVAGMPTNVGFALTDLQGRTLFEWPVMFADSGTTDFALELPWLKSGMYLLQLYTDSEHHQQKLLMGR